MSIASRTSVVTRSDLSSTFPIRFHLRFSRPPTSISANFFCDERPNRFSVEAPIWSWKSLAMKQSIHYRPVQSPLAGVVYFFGACVLIMMTSIAIRKTTCDQSWRAVRARNGGGIMLRARRGCDFFGLNGFEHRRCGTAIAGGVNHRISFPRHATGPAGRHRLRCVGPSGLRL